MVPLCTSTGMGVCGAEEDTPLVSPVSGVGVKEGTTPEDKGAQEAARALGAELDQEVAEPGDDDEAMVDNATTENPTFLQFSCPFTACGGYSWADDQQGSPGERRNPCCGPSARGGKNLFRFRACVHPAPRARARHSTNSESRRTAVITELPKTWVKSAATWGRGLSSCSCIV